MSRYPALDVRGVDPDLVLAAVDDFSPTAVEDLVDGVSVFFQAPDRRDAARASLEQAFPGASLASREVDDEDWARRSQENLTPITVGRLTVAPPWFPEVSGDAPLRVVILPSMGFGTGHHATTRLCLEALQTLDLDRRHVLDVGTGSGVLALAAVRLGCADAVGIDFDPDAIANARENLDLNPGIGTVRFETVDVRDASLPTADVVLANLTGAVLVQHAARLRAAVAAAGTLIVSGLQVHERDEVVGAFAGGCISWEKEDTSWVSIAFNFPTFAAV
ncbi:MAG: 50S ribosomal protein L11 methyltransferase [Vicinamibacterales bacterium]